MVQVLTPDATTSYTYDGLGNRLQRNHNGDITRFVHSGDNVIATADATNTIDQYFIYGLGLEAMIVGSDTYTYHFNGIGSTVAMTDNTENIVNQYAYEAFGKISNENELVNQPFAYVGQYGVQQEPNALYFMRARYYDSNVGRFIKEDPIGLAGGDSVYAYVMNNLIAYIDSGGLLPEKYRTPEPKTSETKEPEPQTPKTPSKREKYKTPENPNKKKPGGTGTKKHDASRERNIGADEEHSRRPKGGFRLRMGAGCLIPFDDQFYCDMTGLFCPTIDDLQL